MQFDHHRPPNLRHGQQSRSGTVVRSQCGPYHDIRLQLEKEHVLTEARRIAEEAITPLLLIIVMILSSCLIKIGIEWILFLFISLDRIYRIFGIFLMVHRRVAENAKGYLFFAFR